MKMQVCLICEGRYPYVAGGVASWVQMVISAFPDIKFKIWSIATTREEMHEYKYKLPENVTEVKTLYIGEQRFEEEQKKLKLNAREVKALKKFMEYDENGWEDILKLIEKYRTQLPQLLKCEEFCDIVLENYKKMKNTVCFNDYLWNYRGMFLPLLSILSEDLIEADIYHTVSTGYAGVLGSVAADIYKKPLIVSEHGIYTREREEDIIRSKWVQGYFKELWIRFFKNMSNIAYKKADVVTTLFSTNQTLQEELGCPGEKIRLIPNGIDVEALGSITKDSNKGDFFDIGAIIRIVPIKDVKTMLVAFSIVKAEIGNARLHILGNADEDPEYYQECVNLVGELNVEDVIFYGQVNIKEYLGKFDVAVLSSISEGQPLAVLEGMAAGLPFVTTNVGACRELLEGIGEDTLGRAGYTVPVMDAETMAEKLIYLAKNKELLISMGEAARKRVDCYYRKEQFLEQYKEMYEKYGEK